MNISRGTLIDENPASRTLISQAAEIGLQLKTKAITCTRNWAARMAAVTWRSIRLISDVRPMNRYMNAVIESRIKKIAAKYIITPANCKT